MLNKIIGFSVKNKLIVGLFVFALVAWGTFEVTKLPIDAVPDITDNQVQVITVSPSLGAPDIERLITFPIEQAVSSITGLKQVRSFSRFGLSLVTVVFEDDVDLYWARQQITEKLQQVQRDIPEGIGSPELAPVSTGLGEIYQYVVRPKKGYEGKYGPMELRTIQDWIVRRQLLGTQGVAEVSSFGGKLKQYEIAIRQEQLKAHGLTIADVFDALEKNNQNTGGAYIEKGPTVLYIRSEGLTSSMQDLEKIVVKQLQGGSPVLIRDVAKVQLGAAIRYGAMTYNDEGEVAGAVVMMLKGENSSAVIKRVKARMEAIQKMLPEGVVVEPFLDRTKMVNNAIKTVETNLIEGALIVIFVLVFFLGNIRAGLIVSSVIPLSMLFAIILMNQFGVGGNLMSLGAIDFGLIVDGSVIVVESILHRFSHSKHFRTIGRITQSEMDEEVNTSTGSMIKSAVFSQIIILIVYLPILSLQGIEGKMFKPMAYTVSFAILGAFLLSITYVPMMSALFLSKKLHHQTTLADRLMAFLEKIYQPILEYILHFPKTVIALTLSLFAVAVLLLGTLGGEFIPQLEEGDFAVETRLLTGSNLNNTVQSTQQASKILLQRFPEVQKVVTKIGSAEVPTDPMPFEAGDMMVILKDKKEWTSAKTFPELSEKMTKALEEVPGISVGFQFPVQMRFNELMTGARQDVVCKIFGEDLDSLTNYAHQLNLIMQSVNGANNIYEERVTGMPQVVITYNRDAMAKFGLNVTDINRVVNTAFAGQIAGQVYEGEKRFDLAVRLDADARSSIQDIQNLMIQTVQGTQIPLSYVASITETEGVNQIQRENTKRRIIVGFNISGRDVQTIVKELQKKVDAQLHMAKGYTMTYGGSFENMTAAKERLGVVVPVALLLIFLLLYFAFSSVKQGLLIYTAIPLSATGGVFALWIRDMPFSISAGVGFIALFGVAVLNGILLVSEFNRLTKEGWTDIRRVVIHATKSKMRAVLMTALVPSLGFIPMAISTGAGGEVQKPLASVVIGGLMVSTMLTLFVLPLLYILFEKGFSFFKPVKKAVVPVILFLAMGSIAQAQQSISLKDAVDSALHANASLRAAKLSVQYQQALRNAHLEFNKTNLEAEYGKFNSNYIDNKISLGQSFDFPTVYKRAGAIQETMIQLSKTDFVQRERDVKKQVKRVFYSLLLLKQKRQLLQEADSIYAIFLDKATLKLKAGDVDLMEQNTAAMQRQQIANQLQTLEMDQSLLLESFHFLLNTSIVYTPAHASIRVVPLLPLDSSIIEQHPHLLYRKTEVELWQHQWSLEKSKLLPSWNVGISSATIMGWQAISATSDQYFGRNHRFNSVVAGIGVPLFAKGQRSKIASAKVMTQQKEAEVLATRQLLQTEVSTSVKKYLHLADIVGSFENTILPNARSLMQGAINKLQHGEISYIEWVMLVNQSIQMRAEYFQSIQNMNEAAIEIESLTNQ